MDQSWFPPEPYYSRDISQLYVRLAHISTDDKLGIRTASKSRIFAILNPLTFKYKKLRLKCSKDHFKNWPLGHGSYRLGGNVGPLSPFIRDAKNNGFDDVLWLLDGYIKEMTFINVFVLVKSRFGHLELITPPNDGCVFNGSLR